MSWAKFCDSASSDPKWITIEREHHKQYAYCWTLWTQAILFCCRHKTDGLIPKRAIKRISPLTDRAVKLVMPILEDVGLFESKGSDIRVHNFLKYNFSREQDEKKAAQNAERQAAFRRRRAEQQNLGANLIPNLDPDSHANLVANFSGDSAENQALAEKVTPLLTGVVTGAPIPIPLKEDRSIHPSSVHVLERRMVLTETHTVIDGLNLHDLQELVAQANLAAGLNRYQRQRFRALPPSNRTREHFAKALGLMREQTNVKHPVSYLLTTMHSLPPDLRAAPQRADRKPNAAGELQAQTKWQKKLGRHWNVRVEHARELEQLNPADDELEAAFKDAGVFSDGMMRLRSQRIAHSARNEVANGTA